MPLAILADHPVDRRRPHQRGVARLGIAGGGQLALPRVDDEEAAIEPARRPCAADRPGCRPSRSGGARRNPSGRRRSGPGMSRWVSSTSIRSCASRSCALTSGCCAEAGMARRRARAGSRRMRIGLTPARASMVSLQVERRRSVSRPRRSASADWSSARAASAALARRPSPGRRRNRCSGSARRRRAVRQAVIGAAAGLAVDLDRNVHVGLASSRRTACVPVRSGHGRAARFDNVDGPFALMLGGCPIRY